MLYFVDTETLGKTSPLISIQWAEGISGERHLHEIWRQPVGKTLELIERIAAGTVVAWNLTFDWFHLVKWYNIFRTYADLYPHMVHLFPEVDLMWEIEEQGPPRDWCVKPVSAIDLMLVARKGRYQHLMKFKPVIIRRVPEIVAEQLAILIDENLKLPPGADVKWKVCKNDRRPGVVDLKCKFIGSTSLKYVHNVATGEPIEGTWGDFFELIEFGTPYMSWGGYWAGAVKTVQKKGFSPEQARYAIKDVRMLQELYEHLGRPEPDTDSVLTALVGATRWRGYRVDAKKIKDSFPVPDYSIKWNSKDQVYQYLAAVMDENELLSLTDPMTKKETTKKDVLREIMKWKLPDGSEHPAAVRAAKVQQERKNEHHRDLMRKLLKANGLFPDMKVGGTLTNRMAGGSSEEASAGKKGGSINPQGIDKVKWMRELFPLAWEGEELSGGDFKAFEISIMDAVWKDPKLHEELLLGKKMIALFGAKVYAPMTYEEVLKTDKEGEGGKYDRAKKGFYARAYGGQVVKLSQVFGLDRDTTARQLAAFDNGYSQIGVQNTMTEKAFTFFNEAYRWQEPQEYAESILGFRRSFKLEQSLARAIYATMRDLPEDWEKLTTIIRRNDKAQSVQHAARSALCGALFSLQGRIIRVAGNFKIQSPGAELNKMLQADIWSLQPTGVSRWLVRPMNVHDEQQVAHAPGMADKIEEKVKEYVCRMKSVIPLIGVDWVKHMHTWADKS